MRTSRIAEVSIVLGRTVTLAVSACIAIDAVLRFPSPLRWVVLLGLVGFTGWLVRRQFIPSLAVQPSRVRLALELESRLPSAAGKLASGVEFSSDRIFDGNPFAGSVKQEAARLVAPEAISNLFSSKRLKQEGLALAVVLAAWAGFFFISPNLAKTGIIRALTPWIAVDWPARTGIRSTTFATHHPKRSALALKADLFRGNAQTESVWARVRRIEGETIGEWEKASLIHQGETRFERLIESGSDAIEFQFLTSDVETDIQRIDFVDAPKFDSIIAVVTPPIYATSLQPERFDLGDGTNHRGRIQTPILEGSFVHLEMLQSLPVPKGDPERGSWIRSTFDWDEGASGESATDPAFTFDEGDGRWTLDWKADRSRSLMIRLVDKHGVHNIDDAKIVVDVTADKPPEAVVVEPSMDETVLATAQIPVKGMARDDVGLESITFEVTRSLEWKKELIAEAIDGLREAVAESLFDLSSANAQPGEVFELVLVAQDSFLVDGVAREPTRSNPRRLRVLTRPQFEEETRNAIAAIRQGSIRVKERQENLLSREESASAQVRPQTDIGERIESIRTMTDSLRTRLDRNDVPDDATRSLLDAADDILKTAQSQSESARNDLQSASQDQDQGEAGVTSKQAQQKIDTARVAQREVRQELDDLATLLQSDKDAWMAARKLEKVAQAIDQSDADRSKAGASTVGRSRDELSPEETASLDRAAESAKAAAQAARETIDELKERATKMKADDPARSMNLNQAAERGERESLAARMDQAEQSTRENRLDQAQQASASARQTVQRMIEDLADDEKARTATLRRRLATLADALEQLLREAESTEDLGIALVVADGDQVAGSAAGVARQAGSLSLNASGVADEGRAAGPSAQRIVRLVERAAEAEGRAATAFAAESPQIALGNENLARGSSLLREALAMVREQEKKNEEQERQQRARELAQEYEALRDRQEGVLTETSAIFQAAAAANDRRTLVESRRLGVEQENIRKAISDISTSSADVKASPTFMEATSIALDSAASAADDLRSGPPCEATIEFEREVLEVLRGLAAALSESARKKDDPFEDDQQSGGGGEGGGGSEQEKPLIPPLSELKVIRSLQQRIYERTKSISDAGGGNIEDPSLVKLSARQESIAKIADALREEVERQMNEREGAGAPKIVPPASEPEVKP